MSVVNRPKTYTPTEKHTRIQLFKFVYKPKHFKAACCHIMLHSHKVRFQIQALVENLYIYIYIDYSCYEAVSQGRAF